MTVLRYADINRDEFRTLLGRYQIDIIDSDNDKDIPGSFWGDEEAGLIGNKLYCRDDTPLHSALHEACHYICMDEQRRRGLHTDAGGGYDEENAVCYLQILLADYIAEMGLARMFSDMDEWGYSFRLGSARRWYEEDAQDALDWLTRYRLLDENQQPNWQCRL
ncbi:MAG: hypothetical protein OEY29_06860 [Gammaproteobacteria bacterium]|nr:hypothetical protein [Gammaproteobacteria bacterium]